MSSRLSTAVILAARRERQHKIPYPLEPISEEGNLLDRTLSILDQLDYKRIIIVTGYEAHLFDRYPSHSCITQTMHSPPLWVPWLGLRDLCRRTSYS